MNTDNSTREYYIHLKESESRMNTHEVRVSLETAKMLQKAGFDLECEYAILPTTEMGNTPYRYNQGIANNYNNKEKYPFEIYSAPSIMVVQRWLKTNHNIHVEVNLTLGPSPDTVYMDDYTYRIITANPKSDIGQIEYPLHGGFSDFDEAFHAGIKKALEIILMKGK